MNRRSRDAAAAVRRAAASAEALEPRRLLAATAELLGAVVAKPLDQPRWLTPAGDALYFVADDGVHGAELWRTDGTAAGTRMVKDVRPGAEGSISTLADIRRPLAVGDTLYFSANDGVHGEELWKTDGTAAGTVLVRDVGPGAASSSPFYLTDVGGTVFYAGSVGYEEGLYRTDGTEAGTRLVKAVKPSTNGSVAVSMVAYGGVLLFPAQSAADDLTLALWRSDGTAEGTYPLRTGLDLNSPSDLTVSGGYAYFQGYGGYAHPEEDGLWRTDGTVAGTVSLGALYAAEAGPRPRGSQGMRAFDGGLLHAGRFFVPGADTGTELWRTDGTPAGTRLVADLYPGPGSSYPDQITPSGSLAYFRAFSTTGYQLWRTDGTAAGTFLFGGFRTGTSGSEPGRLTPAGGDALYFVADDGVVGRRLWLTDGSGPGSSVRIDPAPGAPALSSVADVAVAGGRVYFVGYDAANGYELWRAPDPRPRAAAGGPYAVREGGTLALAATASPAAARLEWDLDYDGTTFQIDAVGAAQTFSAGGMDGPATRTVAVRAVGPDGVPGPASAATVSVTNAAPTAVLAAGPAVAVGAASTVAFTGATDPSAADVAAGFRYSFDFNNDGDFDDAGDMRDSTSPSASRTFPAAGSYPVRGRVTDKDGGTFDATATVVVTPPAGPTPVAKVNFQPAAAPTVAGYLVDAGATYAARNGLTYGWTTSHADAVFDRNKNANQLLDTSVGVKAAAKWELAVPSGTYAVKVGVGDASRATTDNVWVEGQSLFASQPLAANAFASKSITVTVTDGRLTVGIGSAAGNTTFLNYVEVAKPGTPTPTPTTTTLRASADATVRDGSYAATNYGSAAALELRKSSTAGMTRWAVLKFDLTSLATIGKATLRLYGKLDSTANPSLAVQAFAAANATWTEGGVNWNNKPAASGAALGGVTIAGTTAKYYTLDLTAWLKAQKAAGKTSVALVLQASAFSSSAAVLNSDEAAAYRPELVVAP